MKKRVLITGGCGFVGSGLALGFKTKYPEYEIVALDNLKRRGSELNIPRLKSAGIQFVHGDIRNKEDLNAVPKVDLLIDAAAEPSVMAGINGSPDYLIHSNLNGTINCLDLAREHGSDFLFLSTSRVYPIADIEKIDTYETEDRFEIAAQQQIQGMSEKGISEKFPLENSRSLYGATKLAAELFVKEYGETYGIKTIVNRCGVLTGPWQMGKLDQGVIVLWVARHFWKSDLNYIGYGGEGKQVRDLLHINDLFELVDHQSNNFEKLNGQTFNVGGSREVSLSLKELTQLCEEVTGNHINIHKIVENRPADIKLYITDNSKVTAATGWVPKTNPRQIVQDIYDWIKNNEDALKNILN